MSNRREILKAGLVSGALATAGLPLSVASAGHHKAKKSLEILVLGGTGFIGPHMVREALRRGHNVTLFNRGRTNNTLFPDLETIKGDRAGELEGLQGRKWDVVIDNSGYMPQDVLRAAKVLNDNIEHYLFISSISAYESFAQPNDESSPVANVDPVPTEYTNEYYGAFKAIAEKWAAEEIGKERFTVLRPTYICGPGDHTDRFTYFPVRVSKGGEMLMPGSAMHPTQIIDVRDLANFTVDCVQRKTAGIFNTVTPKGSYTLGNLLEDSQAVTGVDVAPIWLDDDYVANELPPGSFPIYHPTSGEYAHVSSVTGERARKAGLHNRPVRETIRDLMTWWNTLDEERVANARFRMTPEQEAEIIASLQG